MDLTPVIDYAEQKGYRIKNTFTFVERGSDGKSYSVPVNNLLDMLPRIRENRHEIELFTFQMEDICGEIHNVDFGVRELVSLEVSR